MEFKSPAFTTELERDLAMELAKAILSGELEIEDLTDDAVIEIDTEQ